jgi:trk system potassium uptake protein TrkA
MYVLLVGGGKVGSNLLRELTGMGHEVTLVEAGRARYTRLEAEFEHQVLLGDGTEIWMLEQAGAGRADLVVAVTGDDEDNLVICQVARQRFGVEKVIARVNDPRNQQHFDFLEISPTVSSTRAILRLVEHEVPAHGFVHLLELSKEDLEIVEYEIGADSPAAGRAVMDLDMPDGSLLISILRGGRSEIPKGGSHIESGDMVLAVLHHGLEDEVRRLFRA